MGLNKRTLKQHAYIRRPRPNAQYRGKNKNPGTREEETKQLTPGNGSLLYLSMVNIPVGGLILKYGKYPQQPKQFQPAIKEAYLCTDMYPIHQPELRTVFPCPPTVEFTYTLDNATHTAGNSVDGFRHATITFSCKKLE